MLELYGAEKFIRDKILAQTGVSALIGQRVFVESAPEGADYPHVIVASMPSGGDMRRFANQRFATNLIYLVYAIDDSTNTTTEAGKVASLVDKALEGARGTVLDQDGLTTIRINSCVRQRPLRLPVQVKGDVRYTKAGGVYRLLVNEE